MTNYYFPRKHCLQYDESGFVNLSLIVDPICKNNLSLKIYSMKNTIYTIKKLGYNEHLRFLKDNETKVLPSFESFHTSLYQMLLNEFDIMLDSDMIIVLGNLLRSRLNDKGYIIEIIFELDRTVIFEIMHFHENWMETRAKIKCHQGIENEYLLLDRKASKNGSGRKWKGEATL